MTRPPGTRNTQWTPAQRADAIGRALAVGADKAAEATGIPRRTISSWLNRERPAPELDGLIVSSRKQVADRLWEAVDVGTEAVLAGLRDPKARLGDKASALRIVAEQYALLTGGVTSRSENLNLTATVPTMTYEQRQDLMRWLDQIDAMTDDDLRQIAPQVIADIRDASRTADAYLAGDPEAVALIDRKDAPNVG